MTRGELNPVLGTGSGETPDYLVGTNLVSIHSLRATARSESVRNDWRPSFNPRSLTGSD